jgi:dTDP-4-amino-4,6-dideoxygalactose transaminase
VLADIDPATFNLDPAAVEAILNGPRGKQSKLCCRSISMAKPVHPISSAASVASVHSPSSKTPHRPGEPNLDGVKAGGLGQVAAFSFYPTKNLSAAGDAGMVTTNSDEIAERVKMLRQHGMRRRYHHDEIGWNARMDGFQGAILSVKLKYIAGWNDARRVVAERYHALFTAGRSSRSRPLPNPRHRPAPPGPGTRHVWHQYVIRTPRRDDLRAFLTERKIGSEIYYPVPLHHAGSAQIPRLQRGRLP